MLRGILIACTLLCSLSSSFPDENFEVDNDVYKENLNFITKLLKNLNVIDIFRRIFGNIVKHDTVTNMKQNQPTMEEEKATGSILAMEIVTPDEIKNRIYMSAYNLNVTWGTGNRSNISGSPRKLAKGSNGLPIPVHTSSPPDYFDWRDKKAVSPVKDQKRCQACWAFSVVANIESMLKIYLNEERILSEQFLIDCDPERGGCHGSASLLGAFGFIVSKLGGVLKYDSYAPYTAQQHECKYKAPPPQPVPVVGMHRVPNNEDEMVAYLYRYGPLSAAINSKSMDVYNVDKGIYIDDPTDELCSKDKLDHTILIVGYNIYVDSSSGERVPYWIIKNSWGSSWGDKGFYYLVRGRNACGIASDVSFASVI